MTKTGRNWNSFYYGQSIILFWGFLFYGIIEEQDRREKQKSSRKWMQDRALNEWATDNKPELAKAMRIAQEEE